MKAPSAIRRRIALWYAGAAVAVLLSTMVTLRELVRASIEREFAQSLDASVQLVRGFFRAEVREYRTVQATVFHIGGETVFADRRLTFLRPDGSVAEVASGRVNEAPPLKPPVRDTLAPLDPELAPGWMVRVQHSQSVVAAFEQRLDVWFYVGIPALIVLSTLVGWWLAGRTLAPVAAMAHAAEGIDADHPSSRLPVADPGDELGRLGTRFNAVLDRLDGALAQQRTFLAAAAHELRTPIARLSAMMEAARSEGDASARAALLSQADAEVARTAHLVDELMQLARADALANEVRLADGFLDDVVTDVVAAFGPVARQQGVALEVEALEEAPARLDARLVDRLAGILIDNALRYTPTGGRVRVRVERVDGCARLTVQDSGIGISPEDGARIFERFFRGAAARQRVPNGSGLGLAIAKWICDQHNATISALSNHSESGTTFSILFPRVLDQKSVDGILKELGRGPRQRVVQTHASDQTA